MNPVLEKIDKENKLCFLTGDFNIDLLKSTRPTRITQHTATLIDNIFTNDIETIKSSTNWLIFCDISDHLPIVHIRNSKKSPIIY
jgi:hypothetical protein